MNSNKPIFIVEDDEVDILMITRALKEINLANEIIFIENGEDALKKLEAGKPILPCLILLDLNMPKMNGLEFLKQMKSDDNLKRIPVVVLTSSDEEKDIKGSYDLGIAGYIVKPFTYMEFVKILKTLDLYWTINEPYG